MDDIQFWLYLLFAAIYLISRGLKKKDPQKPKNRPASSPDQERPQRKPVSFDELLKEFTEGKKALSHERDHQFEEKKEQEVEYQTVEELDEMEQAEPIEEGKTRRFSDEESRRVYEESIARAEGAKIEFERDDHFKSKLKRKAEEREASFAAEIRSALSNPEDARKAIVLSEILNRKY